MAHAWAKVAHVDVKAEGRRPKHAVGLAMAVPTLGAPSRDETGVWVRCNTASHVRGSGLNLDLAGCASVALPRSYR